MHRWVSGLTAVTGCLALALAACSGEATGKADAGCDCTSLAVGEGCKTRSVQYYIEVPPGCQPATLALIDPTNAAYLWGRTVYTQDQFESLDAEAQTRCVQNDAVIGVESNAVYNYQGPNGTNITVVRRGGDPTKWLVELSSCCHAIPTLQIGLDCGGPGTQIGRRMEVGLSFDENDQYVVQGQVLVNGRELTRENYNSFFGDCSVPYCEIDDRSSPQSLGSNGRIRLHLTPDHACRLDLGTFRRDLYEALRRAGCLVDVPIIDARHGYLSGWIYTNRCTPEIAACIEQVLKRHTTCKQVSWIGRQINITPVPHAPAAAKTAVAAGLGVGAVDTSQAKVYLAQLLAAQEVSVPALEEAVARLAETPDLVPLPLVGGRVSFPVGWGMVEIAGGLLTDELLQVAGFWPCAGFGLGDDDSAGLHLNADLFAYRTVIGWHHALDLGFVAAGVGLGGGVSGGILKPELTSTDAELEGLFPKLPPDAFHWAAAGTVVWGQLEVGLPSLRLWARADVLIPLLRSAGAANLAVAPVGAALGLLVTF
ncbi:MAG: hypothetical protein ACP5G2_02425 [Candidatus Bipolaricaulaceae bacterium]